MVCVCPVETWDQFREQNALRHTHTQHTHHTCKGATSAAASDWARDMGIRHIHISNMLVVRYLQYSTVHFTHSRCQKVSCRRPVTHSLPPFFLPSFLPFFSPSSLTYDYYVTPHTHRLSNCRCVHPSRVCTYLYIYSPFVSCPDKTSNKRPLMYMLYGW